MSEPLKAYEGTLRPKITILDEEQAKVEWLDDVGTVIWTETVKPRKGYSFMSQVTCTGKFNIAPGYFVDEDGKRHFVLNCDPGKLGALFSTVNMFGNTQ